MTRERGESPNRPRRKNRGGRSNRIGNQSGGVFEPQRRSGQLPGRSAQQEAGVDPVRPVTGSVAEGGLRSSQIDHEESQEATAPSPHTATESLLPGWGKLEAAVSAARRQRNQANQTGLRGGQEGGIGQSLSPSAQSSEVEVKNAAPSLTIAELYNQTRDNFNASDQENLTPQQQNLYFRAALRAALSPVVEERLEQALREGRTALEFIDVPDIAAVEIEKILDEKFLERLGVQSVELGYDDNTDDNTIKVSIVPKPATLQAEEPSVAVPPQVVPPRVESVVAEPEVTASPPTVSQLRKKFLDEHPQLTAGGMWDRHSIEEYQRVIEPAVVRQLGDPALAGDIQVVEFIIPEGNARDTNIIRGLLFVQPGVTVVKLLSDQNPTDGRIKFEISRIPEAEYNHRTKLSPEVMKIREDFISDIDSDRGREQIGTPAYMESLINGIMMGRYTPWETDRLLTDLRLNTQQKKSALMMISLGVQDSFSDFETQGGVVNEDISRFMELWDNDPAHIKRLEELEKLEQQNAEEAKGHQGGGIPGSRLMKKWLGKLTGAGRENAASTRAEPVLTNESRIDKAEAELRQLQDAGLIRRGPEILSIGASLIYTDPSDLSNMVKDIRIRMAGAILDDIDEAADRKDAETGMKLIEVARLLKIDEKIPILKEYLDQTEEEFKG